MTCFNLSCQKRGTEECQELKKPHSGCQGWATFGSSKNFCEWDVWKFKEAPENVDVLCPFISWRKCLSKPGTFPKRKAFPQDDQTVTTKSGRLAGKTNQIVTLAQRVYGYFGGMLASEVIICIF